MSDRWQRYLLLLAPPAQIARTPGPQHSQGASGSARPWLRPLIPLVPLAETLHSDHAHPGSDPALASIRWRPPPTPLGDTPISIDRTPNSACSHGISDRSHS
jgi:hypothetical protein